MLSKFKILRRLEMTLTIKRKLPTLKRNDEENCTVVLTLDTRHAPTMKELRLIQEQGKAVDDFAYPVVIRVTADKKRVFLPTGKKFTEPDYLQMCNALKEREQKGRNGSKLFLKECNELIGTFNRAVEDIDSLTITRTFSLDALVEKFTGKTDKKKCNLNTIWQEVIDAKYADKKARTAQAYTIAMRRFEKDMCKTAKGGGYIGIPFTRISNSFIHDWRRKMLAGGVNPTTAGIYLRTMRAIVNVSIERGLMNGNSKELFKNAQLSHTGQRTGEFLDAQTMQKLYDFWLADEAKDAEGNELFALREKRALFRDLCYFLFSYLGNGMNVADMVHLRYDEQYTNSNGTEFIFMRQKTLARTGGRSIVVVPIDLLPMQKLLGRLATIPKPGAYVFPILNGS